MFETKRRCQFRYDLRCHTTNQLRGGDRRDARCVASSRERSRQQRRPQLHSQLPQRNAANPACSRPRSAHGLRLLERRDQCWEKQRRFIFIRTRDPSSAKNRSGWGCSPPYEYGYQFKAILTNAKLCARKLLRLHNGRGAQEGIFAGLKSQNADGLRAVQPPWRQSNLVALGDHGAQSQPRAADVG